MEGVKPRGRRGRPTKLPRRAFPEAEDINKINAAEDTAETSFENYCSDSNNSARFPAEGSSEAENKDTVARVVKPRRCPRKGIPVRSLFY